MAKNGADIEADIKTAEDRGETVSLMEPILIGDGSRHRAELTDLALDLAQKSAGFRRSLPESLVTSLADLVRSMNCYYSNLIEGHDTHPIEIERALKGDYSKDAKKRALQLEAQAHIAVQRWIDDGGLKGRATTVEAMRGELPRGEAADIVGTGDRQARRVVAALLDRGVLTSASTRVPLRLAFPAALASRWMPGLFPEQV